MNLGDYQTHETRSRNLRGRGANAANSCLPVESLVRKSGGRAFSAKTVSEGVFRS